MTGRGSEQLSVVHFTAGIVPIHGEFGGGVERHIRSVAGELVDRGHDVTLVDRRYDRDDPETVVGADVVRVGAPSVSTGLLDGWADHVFNEGLQAVALGTARSAVAEADIVHAHNAYVGTRALRLARRSGVPFAYTCHNGMWCAPDANVYERQVIRRIEGRLLRKSDVPIAVSDAVASGVRQRTSADPRVVPNGVDVEYYNPSADTTAVRERYDLRDEPVILFVGRLVRAKGVDVLVRAIARVREETDERVRLVLVGPNKHMFGGSEGDTYTGRIRRLVDQTGLGSDVVLAGQIPDDELRDLYAAADILALPSRFEAQGMVLLEALASGTPVVGTDVGGIPEVITTDVGRVVPSEDHDELAGALIDVLADDGQMGRAARTRAEERYSWDRIVDDVESAYREVC